MRLPTRKDGVENRDKVYCWMGKDISKKYDKIMHILMTRV